LDQYRFKRIRRVFTVGADFNEEKIYGENNRGTDQRERERLLRSMFYNIRLNWSRS
jgi:hypothetical protein